MERTTKEIITPVGGHKVVMHDFLIGREIEEIEDLYVHNAKSDEVNIIKEAKHKAMEILIVSIDGEKGEVVEKILDFHKDDYKFIADQLAEIIEGKEDDSKKKIGE